MLTLGTIVSQPTKKGISDRLGQLNQPVLLSLFLLHVLCFRNTFWKLQINDGPTSTCGTTSAHVQVNQVKMSQQSSTKDRV